MSEVKQFYGAVLSRTAPYELTNKPHRRMMLALSGDASIRLSAEVGTMNGQQEIAYTETSVSALRALSYKSGAIVSNDTPVQLDFSQDDSVKLRLMSHTADIGDIGTIVFNPTYTVRQSTIRSVDAYSGWLQPPDTTQAIIYRGKTFSLKNGSYISAAIHGLDVSQLIYFQPRNGNKLTLIQASTAHKWTNVQVPSDQQQLVFGGDNVFCTLNGVYNFFRRHYFSLLDTAYRVRIGKNIVNFYDSHDRCIESKRGGSARATVASNFLKDTAGEYKAGSSVPLICHDNRVVFYDDETRRLYTYDLDNCELTIRKYFNLDSAQLPQKVSLQLDVKSKTPIATIRSTEGGQRLTEPDEFWNFLQVDNVKLIPDVGDLNAAEASYKSYIHAPVNTVIENTLFFNDFVLTVSTAEGVAKRSLYSIDCATPGIQKLLYMYYGSTALFSFYPHVYFSEYDSQYSTLGEFSFITTLNIETLEKSRHIAKHRQAFVGRYAGTTHAIYVTANGSVHYCHLGTDRHIDLTSNFGINGTILDFQLFESGDAFLMLSDRSIFRFNLNTMDSSSMNSVGTAVRLVRINDYDGCVLTRKDDHLFFETITGVEWPSNPNLWRTPTDMHSGELLLPYQIGLNALLSRTAPIKPLFDIGIVEYAGVKHASTSVDLINSMSKAIDVAEVTPIAVGITMQKTVGNLELVAVNLVEQTAAACEYSDRIHTEVSLSDSGAFTIAIKDTEFPEELSRGFKVYER